MVLAEKRESKQEGSSQQTFRQEGRGFRKQRRGCVPISKEKRVQAAGGIADSGEGLQAAGSQEAAGVGAEAGGMGFRQEMRARLRALAFRQQ